MAFIPDELMSTESLEEELVKMKEELKCTKGDYESLHKMHQSIESTEMKQLTDKSTLLLKKIRMERSDMNVRCAKQEMLIRSLETYASKYKLLVTRTREKKALSRNLGSAFSEVNSVRTIVEKIALRKPDPASWLEQLRQASNNRPKALEERPRRKHKEMTGKPAADSKNDSSVSSGTGTKAPRSNAQRKKPNNSFDAVTAATQDFAKKLNLSQVSESNGEEKSLIRPIHGQKKPSVREIQASLSGLSVAEKARRMKAEIPEKQLVERRKPVSSVAKKSGTSNVEDMPDLPNTSVPPNSDHPDGPSADADVLVLNDLALSDSDEEP